MRFCCMNVAVNDNQVSSKDERVMHQLGNGGDEENLFLELRILAWRRQLII